MKGSSQRYRQRMSPKPTNSRSKRTRVLKDMDETCSEHHHHTRGAAIQMKWTWMVLLPLLLLLCASCTEACSSRLRNRNRPPTHPPPVTTTLRPTIVFDVFACPPLLEQVFCLNNASCFAIKVGDVVEYNCNCTEGFMGRRCEHKYVDIDDELLSQLSIQESKSGYAVMVGATVYLLLLSLGMGVWYYIRRKKHQVNNEMQDVDQVDGINFERPRPFGPRTMDLAMERLVKKTVSISKENGSRKEGA